MTYVTLLWTIFHDSRTPLFLHFSEFVFIFSVLSLHFSFFLLLLGLEDMFYSLLNPLLKAVVFNGANQRSKSAAFHHPGAQTARYIFF